MNSIKINYGKDAYLICVFFSLIITFCNDGNSQSYILLDEEILGLEDYYRVSPSVGYKNISGLTKINLKPYCPSVGNQGNTGSCAAFASAYGTMTISYAINNNITNQQQIDQIRFSPSFVYNQLIDTACHKPLNVIEVLDFLKQNGSCPFGSMKFTEDCSINPDKSAHNLAKEYKIEMAAKLFSSQTDNISKVQLIKQYLSDSIPIIALIQVYDSFIDSKSKSIWSYDSEYDNYMGGSHAVVITGFDEAKGVFEIMNSWGKSWGNDGFIYIPYESFGEVCMSAMIIEVKDSQIENTLATEEIIKQSDKRSVKESLSLPQLSSRKGSLFLKNNFIVKKVVVNGSLILDQIIKPKYDEEQGFYLIDGIQQGDNIQFLSSNLTKDNYVYILSQDPDNIINIHWPKPEEIDDDKIIQKQISSGGILTIPSSDSVMRKSKIGSEWILILSSKKALDIKGIISKFTINYPNSKISEIDKLIINGKVDQKLIQANEDKIEAFVKLSDDSQFIMPILINIK